MVKAVTATKKGSVGKRRRLPPRERPLAEQIVHWLRWLGGGDERGAQVEAERRTGIGQNRLSPAFRDGELNITIRKLDEVAAKRAWPTLRLIQEIYKTPDPLEESDRTRGFTPERDNTKDELIGHLEFDGPQDLEMAKLSSRHVAEQGLLSVLREINVALLSSPPDEALSKTIAIFGKYTGRSLDVTPMERKRIERLREQFCEQYEEITGERP